MASQADKNNTYLQKPQRNSSMLVKHIQVTLHSKNLSRKQNKLRTKEVSNHRLKIHLQEADSGIYRTNKVQKHDCYHTEEPGNIS